jgi:DNA topoisomerase-1
MDETIVKLEAGRRRNWWQRVGSQRRGFHYLDAAGNHISNPEALDRIRSLVLPPAWKHVRINPASGGRIQALGIDAAGRLQYRYHPDFSARRQRLKFDKIVRFGRMLPILRQVANEHICQDGVCRERVLAVMIRLVNDLYFRVGSETSVRTFRTYGITTLRNQHLTIGRRGDLRFSFLAKRRIRQRKVLVDADLAQVVAEIKAVRGTRLFNYVDESGRARAVRASDINNYIKSAIGPEFSAKDFRTWAGTLLAAEELASIGPPETESQAKRNLAHAMRAVAERLGNTPAVARSSYVHPGVVEKYLRGVTLEKFRRRAERIARRNEPELSPEEIALLDLLTT